MKRLSAAALVLVLLPASCQRTAIVEEAELVYSDSPAVWVAPLPEVRIAPDQSTASFGSGKWLRVIDLDTGRARSDSTRLDEPNDLESPSDAVTRRSPTEETLAFYRPSEPTSISVDSKGFLLDGDVKALEWSHDGAHVLALVTEADGGSSIVRVHPGDESVETLVADLDAPLRGNAIGVTPDGQKIYLALASDDTFDVHERHLPDVDRDLDIYEVNLATGAKTFVTGTPMDELSPKVAGDYLYWTRIRYRQSIAAFSAEGGYVHLIAEDGQLPYWRHDSRAVGYTVGLPSAADAPLNMDADVVEVDESARPVGEPRRIIEGLHEDFTPAWSPDGRWLAFHSHRSETAVPFYHDAGVTDDTYLLRAGASMAEEIRLTDFGWEAGMADWAPDGRRMIFSTWEEGAPGIGVPWIVTIDPDSGAVVDTERVSLPEPLRSARLVAWAPAGERIAIENDDGDGRESIWVLDLESHALERVVEYACDTYCGVDWTPDGETLVYAALHDGRYQIFAVPAEGGEPTKLTDEAGQLLQPQVSPDGRFIAATHIELSRELWRRKR